MPQNKNLNTPHMKNLIYILIIAVFAAGCGNMANQGVAKNESANKDRVAQFYEKVVNAHNVDMIDSFCTADFVDHNPDMGHSGKGTDDLKASFKEFFAAFPDVHMTANFMVAEGDKVVSHLTITGTNTGAMGNMPATGKSMNVDGIDIVGGIKDGKASERWGFFDNMKMMMQMGMMPPAGAPPTAPSEPMKMEEKKK
jgi:steroid delta-isomerase-like uncharacterized protein